MKATYVDHMGTDLSVVNAARVSFAKSAENYNEDQNNKLIKYLAKHNHKSPFNHTFITLHIKAPIFVARQLVKNKFMPWNEVSRRYVDELPELYKPDEWRSRAENKKQGSGENLNNDLQSDLNFSLRMHDRDRLGFYVYLLERGVAPEQARMVLPLNTYTEWYWSGTLGAWADMYNQRSKSDAQWETQQIALQCGEIIKPLFPVSWEALTNNK